MLRIKITLYFLAIIFISQNVTAQNINSNRSKFKGLLPLLFSRNHGGHYFEKGQRFGADDNIPVIVEVASPDVFNEIKKWGVIINTQSGNFATTRLNREKLLVLASFGGVKSIDYNKVVPLYDNVRKLIRADKVYNGAAPLPKSLYGKGVIIGVVDSGIDIYHPDFRVTSDQSKSRILTIWDQNSNTGAIPVGLNYGIVWNKTQIEKELSNNPPKLVNARTKNQVHGTFVTGIAAGNSGIAPDADIVFVNSDSSLGGIIDGIEFIKKYAKDLNRPCVVNLSLGTNISNHEGDSGFSKFIDNLLEDSENFAIVAGAGNSGDDFSHWRGRNIKNDTAIMYTGVSGQVLGFFRVPKIFGDSLEFAVGVDSAHFDLEKLKFTGKSKFLGSTPWKSISSIEDNEEMITYSNGDVAGYVGFYGALNDSLPYYSFLVHISDYHDGDWYDAPEEMNIYRLMFRGSGQFDGWLQFEDLPLVLTKPEEIGLPTQKFVPPDNDYGVASPADGKNVIAVGAYVNRPTWTDVQGKVHYSGTVQKTGELADFSSVGPTFDGRIKPEITAPGKHVISTFPISWKLINNPAPYTDTDLKNYLTDTFPPHACVSGTSIASPVVAGSIALLMQAKPGLNYSKIKDLLISTAIKDEFTNSSGPIPNPKFGYGKIDVFSALKAALGSTSIDDIQNIDFIIYPNPVSDYLNIQFNENKNSSDVRIRIIDVNGRVQFEKNGINQNDKINIQHLSSGVYFVELHDGTYRSIDKFLVFR